MGTQHSSGRQLTLLRHLQELQAARVSDLIGLLLAMSSHFRRAPERTVDFRLAPRIEKLRILGLAYPTARMAEACYWALRGGTGGGGSFRPVLDPSHRRTVPENSQSSPTMATADIVHQITAESATASIVGQG